MKTAIVTGANRGIGLELCKQLQQEGHKVIGVCRKTSPELQQLDVRIMDGIDVTSDQSLEQLAEKLKGESIDLLINNAGIMRKETIDNMDLDTIREQFEVNSIGPLRMTKTLLPLLASDAKVAIITSRMGSIHDNTSGGRYGYRMSKAAVNMAGVSLAHDLKPRGIAVALLHPGYVQTDMTNHNGDASPEHSVNGLLQRIGALNLDNTGTFWHAQGEELPW